jgi:hypothetical protein
MLLDNVVKEKLEAVIPMFSYGILKFQREDLQNRIVSVIKNR